MIPLGKRKAARSRPSARSLTLMASAGSVDHPTGDPTVTLHPDAPTDREPFSDVEGERLFAQVRARIFARGSALRVGRYRIVRRLGAGAMGEVQLAIDEDLDRPIAIKFVHGHLASPSFTSRLRTEARALARLAHPNVVHVYEVGEHDDQVYLAMEYIEGTSLRDWIRHAAPGWEQVLAAYLAAGRGLAAAHGAGVIHRDFKPENVLRGHDGRVAVADFGLAALEQGRALADEELRETAVGTSESQSRTGEIKGTPAYMPPEQFLGRSDARADQFALCVSLYEALWGQRPFPWRELDSVPRARTDWIPRPPPRRSPVPGWLWPVIRRGLAYAPDERWSDVDALLAALERGLSVRRRRARVLGSGVAALGVGVLSGVAVAWWSEPEPVDACATLDRELQGTWDHDRREQLTAAFARASEQPGALWLGKTAVPVVAGLDRWREQWLASRGELCRARAGGDPVILDRFGACLERQRRTTEATIGLLIAGDVETLADAPLAVHNLADPLACEHEARQGGPPQPPQAIADEVEQLRAKLALVEAELATGDHAAALTRANALATEVRELDYMPLQAEVAHFRGLSLLATQPEQGLEMLEQAVDLAEGARHDRVVAESWRRMAMFAATKHIDLQRGRQWLRRADAAATRLGGDPLSQARLDFIRGNLHLHGKHNDAAVEVLALAQGVFEERGDLLYASYTASSLGLALLDRGDEQRAIEMFTRALEQLEQVYGSYHPDVALAAYNLGQTLIAERPEIALQLLERAVEIWSAAESLPTRNVGQARIALAQLALEGGRFEQAREHAEAAATVFEELLPPEDVAHAEAAVVLATSCYFLADAEPAIAAWRRGVAGYSAALGADDVHTANFRVGLAWALLAADELEQARSEFTAGLAVIEANLGVGTEDSADARLGLVAVELASGSLKGAAERLDAFATPPVGDMNLLVFELFRGLLAVRRDPSDPAGAELLGRARERAQQMAGGEQTLAVMLDSVE
jgi:tetratricopeptide (TPR) repeat protein